MAWYASSCWTDSKSACSRRVDDEARVPELEPELARAWKVTENGRAIRFELRKGVKFSDGAPFTAEDVAFISTDANPYLPAYDKTVAQTVTSCTSWETTSSSW